MKDTTLIGDLINTDIDRLDNSQSFDELNYQYDTANNNIEKLREELYRIIEKIETAETRHYPKLVNWINVRLNNLVNEL